MFYYDSKPYILKTFQTGFLERNHDDLFAEHLKVVKTLEFFTLKYYWSNIRADIDKYK